ncbi:MAG TPA: right-handed parallel beta-helix repeat-containing protein [Terrimicrobiaceae bacterium]
MPSPKTLLASLFIITAIVLCFICGAKASNSDGKRHYWIAARNDGKPGRGTQANPFDGSTQVKFDTLLRRFWSERRESVVFHLGPGVYETIGNGGYIAGLRELGEGWRCWSGWEIRGSGQDRTILKLTKQYEYHGLWSNVAVATHDSSVNGVVVQDLTVDCNHSAIGNQKSSETGVSLHGSGHTIRRVTVRNVAGKGYEGFPIGIGANSVDSAHNLIEDCTIIGWRGGTGGSITISNNVNNLRQPLTYISGIVRRNRVVGTEIGYGGWGMKGVVFEDNLAEDCGYGSNVDSVRNPQITFRNNRFLECRNYGSVFANCENILIEKNTFTLSGPGPAIYVLNDCANFRVEGNSFAATDPRLRFSVVQTRDGETFRGTFHFSGNQVPSDASVSLPEPKQESH